MRRNLATFAILGLMAAPLLAAPAWAQSTPRDNSGSGSSRIGHGSAQSPAVTPSQPGATPRDESGSGSSARGGPGTGPVR
ncbi:hypothetical protein RQ831_12410 [Roseomonas gilardii]|uniref:Uncharacterized protein n=1 Tax=Roseomonas gilardii TaxID=257708 RepID=A0ABU3MFW3_9PROT|nr:hypothetical protein [Roseomonas gilardii]MDT8331858.1 hypothetical protein [Roseomonas gilardii]